MRMSRLCLGMVIGVGWRVWRLGGRQVAGGACSWAELVRANQMG